MPSQGSPNSSFETITLQLVSVLHLAGEIGERLVALE